MIKTISNSNFRAGNYIKKPGGAIYIIDKIIDSGSTLEIRKLNSWKKIQEIEIVEKHEVYGIELKPDDMISLGLKVEGADNKINTKGNIYNLRCNGKVSQYFFQIYNNSFISWTNLPDIHKLEQQCLSMNAFLITNNIHLKNGLDWEKIDEYVEEGSLIPMKFLHTLQNYVEDNNLSFLSLDYNSIVSKKF